MSDYHPDDRKVIGRWGARVSSSATEVYEDGKRDEAPMLMYFDGKSFTPVGVNGMGNQGAGLFGGYPGYAPLNGRRLLHGDYHYALAYLASEYAFNCINLLAGDVTRAKRGVRNKATGEDIPDHPLMKALSWARLTYQQDIIELWVMARYIWGEVYIEPCKLGWRDPVTGRELYGGVRWLNPIVTEPIVMYDYINYFEYTGGMSVQQYKPGELVYDKFGSMVSDIRGQSRIAVALDAVSIDREIKRYTLDTLLKDMRLAGMITGRQGSNISFPELEQFLAKMKEQVNSRLIALPMAVEYQRIQQEIDGSQLQLSSDAQKRIAAAIGIPESVAGAWHAATYQSSPAQMIFYYQNVIDPLCDKLSLVITDTLLPFFDPSGLTEFYLDISDSLAMVEDKKQKAEIQNSRLAAGTITINEHRKAMGDDEIEGGDVLMVPIGVTIMPVDKLAQMAQMNTQSLLPDGTPIAANTAVLPPAAVPALPEPGAKDACLMLKIGADPDLIALQQRVKQLCAGLEVRWETPDDFHITLVYAPTLTDTQAAQLILALNDLAWDEEMELRVGSLGSFDTVQEYAVRFLISKKADIAGLQESAYDLFNDLGIGVRQHHQPARYHPHVTMGYSNEPFQRTTFKGKIALTPQALELWHGDARVYSRAFREADEPDEVRDELVEIADELRAWRKKAHNSGAVKALKFTANRTPDYLVEFVKFELGELGADASKGQINALFDDVDLLRGVKTYSETRDKFKRELRALIKAGLDNETTRRSFASDLRTLARRSGLDTVYNAFEDAGAATESIEPSTLTIFRAWQSETSDYITKFSTEIFADGLTPEQVDQRVDMWARKTLDDIYYAALREANDSIKATWNLGNTEDHCSTCRSRDGQSKTIDEWGKIGFPKDRRLECGGWHCDCFLTNPDGRRLGSR